MTGYVTIFLAVGLIFPVISLLSGIASLLHQWRHKECASPIFIPFIGPLLLTCWVLLAHKSRWLLPAVWILDIGTLAFLSASPRLIAEWWRVSRFTRILSLHGTQEIQSALLTLHSTGNYVLKKSWRRAPGELGIVGLGEPGRFTSTGAGYDLISQHGLHRILRKTSDGSYAVDEDQLPREELAQYSINGWRLTT